MFTKPIVLPWVNIYILILYSDFSIAFQCTSNTFLEHSGASVHYFYVNIDLIFSVYIVSIGLTFVQPVEVWLVNCLSSENGFND